MKQILPTNRGVDAKIFINDVEVGGQLNAVLSQKTKIIDITNKITGEWETSLAGPRSWELSCSGMKIIGAAAFTALQTAFNEGSIVQIRFVDEGVKYVGNAIISSFPLVANYNLNYNYNVVFNGVGSFVVE